MAHSETHLVILPIRNEYYRVCAYKVGICFKDMSECYELERMRTLKSILNIARNMSSGFDKKINILYLNPKTDRHEPIK